MKFTLSKKLTYILSGLLLIIASMLNIGLINLFKFNDMFVIYYPAIFIAAILGDIFTGCLTTILACLTVIFVTFRINQPIDPIAMTLFAFNGGLISILTKSRENNTQKFNLSRFSYDIEQQKLYEKKLRHLAEHDSLTGLINRPSFEERFEKAILLAQKQQDKLAVCFVDIDDFKSINDHYGHTIGDLLLCAATQRMQYCMRNIDTLARLGGDEFALILLNLTTDNDAINIIKKIMKNFSKSFMIKDQEIIITLSIGIALYPQNGHESLLEKADIAMYDVKKNGKNNFRIFADLEKKPQTIQEVS